IYNLQDLRNKKLKGQLAVREELYGKSAQAAAKVEKWLMPSEGGYLEAEGIEKTWRIKQEAIALKSIYQVQRINTILSYQDLVLVKFHAFVGVLRLLIVTINPRRHQSRSSRRHPVSNNSSRRHPAPTPFADHRRPPFTLANHRTLATFSCTRNQLGSSESTRSLDSGDLLLPLLTAQPPAILAGLAQSPATLALLRRVSQLQIHVISACVAGIFSDFFVFYSLLISTRHLELFSSVYLGWTVPDLS
ncbi:hypothetical protein C3L33_10578, partial [Rhododendron williamsianum]